MSRLPLESMSLDEKLEEMEAIWADLCRNHSESLTPDWHGEVLEAREAEIARGEMTYEDFDVAKERMLAEIEKDRAR